MLKLWPGVTTGATSLTSVRFTTTVSTAEVLVPSLAVTCKLNVGVVS